MTTRRILKLTGPDTDSFLQGLITNDIKRLDSGLVYAALLTPQGKYVSDFFLKRDGEAVLLDVAELQAEDLTAARAHDAQHDRVIGPRGTGSSDGAHEDRETRQNRHSSRSKGRKANLFKQCPRLDQDLSHFDHRA